MRPAHVFVLLLLLAPVAMAGSEGVSGALTFRSAPWLRGHADVTATDGFLSLSEAVNATGVTLRWSSASGYQVERATSGLATAATRDVYVHRPPPGNESLSFGEGTLTKLHCREHCKVLLFPLEDGEIGLRGALEADLAHLPGPVVHYVGTWASGSDGFHLRVPAGAAAFRGGDALEGEVPLHDARPHVQGRVGLLLWEATAVVETPSGPHAFDTFTRTEHHQAVGEHASFESRTTRFVVLELEDAHLDAPTGSPLLLVASDPSLRLRGLLVGQDAAGHVRVGGERHGFSSKSVLIEGDLGLEPRGAPQAMRLDQPPLSTATLEGHATRVVLDGERVGAAPRDADVARAAGGAALVALLLALAASGLRVVVLPLYSRIDRPHVLNNENRRLVMHAVCTQPGATIKSIAEATDLSRVVVRHHLRFLEAHAFVHSVAKARGRLYYPPEVRPDAVGVALASSSVSRKRLLDVLRAAPRPLTQKEIAARAGVSVRLASYHLGALQREGMATTEPEAFPRRYRATPLAS